MATFGHVTFAEFEVPPPPQSTVTVTLTPNVDTDQWSSLQSQINAAPNGTAGTPTIINLPAGRYRINKRLLIQNRSHLRITCPTGVQTYPVRPADDEAFWAYTDLAGGFTVGNFHYGIWGCTDVVISKCAIDGPRLDRLFIGSTPFAAYGVAGGRDNENAFEIVGASADCGYEDCFYTNVGGDGCYVGQAGDTNAGDPTNTNSHFTRVRGSFASRHCFTVVSGDGVDWTDCQGFSAGFAGVDFEPNGFFNVAKNITMTRCTMGAKTGCIAISAANLTHDVPARTKIANITLNDIVINAPPGNARSLVVDGCTDVGADGGLLLVDNLSDDRNTEYVGMVITWSTDVTIQNCVIPLKDGGGHTPETQYALRSYVYGKLTLIGNTFNGDPVKGGYDNLANLAVIPSQYIHYGNVWDRGAQNDGVSAPTTGILVNGGVMSANGLLIRT